MKLTITIELDNAAFEERGTLEVHRILSDLCERLPDPLIQSDKLSLRDANGNWVGEAQISGK